jgi:hypothetical protein
LLFSCDSSIGSLSSPASAVSTSAVAWRGRGSSNFSSWMRWMIRSSSVDVYSCVITGATFVARSTSTAMSNSEFSGRCCADTSPRISHDFSAMSSSSSSLICVDSSCSRRW